MTINLDPQSSSAFGRRRIIRVTLSDAFTLLVGFAFGRADRHQPYGSANPFLFGYRSWDCALRNHAEGLSEADVLASTGLNSGLDVSVILRLLAVIDSATLPNLGENPEFWDLDAKHLFQDPGAGHPEHLLWTLHRELTKINGVGGPVCSKIVAHRWPSKFPLWDSMVSRVYHGGDAWGEMCEDLQAGAAWWAELERRFDTFRMAWQDGGGVPLPRTRCLDILVWSSVTEQWKELIELGAPMVENLPPWGSW